MLTPFILSARVDAEEAKQDLIELEFTDWVIQTEHDRLNDFYGYLAAGPAITNPRASLDAPDYHFSSLFVAPSGRGNNIRSIPIRSVLGPQSSGSSRQSDDEQDDPSRTVALFRGVLRDYWQEGRHRLRADLQINPTRFAAYQSSNASLPAEWPHPRLFARRRTLTGLSQFVLGDVHAQDRFIDNVILNQRQLSFCRPANWPHHVRRYWQSIRQALDHQIHSAVNHMNSFSIVRGRPARGIEIRPLLELKLKLVESYFEFEARDPVGLVHSLVRPLMALPQESLVRGYSVAYPEMSRHRNSPCITLRLRDGVSLRIYAKTNRRVRWEVIHDFKKNRLCASGQGISRITSTTDPDQILNWLPACAADAAIEVNRVLAFLERFEGESDFDAPIGVRPYRLLLLIASASPTADIANFILEAMCEAESIILTPNAPFRSALLELVEQDVLARTGPRSSNFVVTPEFRPVIEAIRRGRFR